MVGLRSLSQRTRPGGVLTASCAWQSTSNQLVHTRCWNHVDCYRLDDDGDDGDDDGDDDYDGDYEGVVMKIFLRGNRFHTNQLIQVSCCKMYIK